MLTTTREVKEGQQELQLGLSVADVVRFCSLPSIFHIWSTEWVGIGRLGVQAVNHPH